MHESDIKDQETIRELRKVAGNSSLQIKDMVEISSWEPEVQDDQQIYYLPVLKLYVAVELVHTKVAVPKIKDPEAEEKVQLQKTVLAPGQANKQIIEGQE